MKYGWAILVVLAAIGALAYFGVLETEIEQRCSITGMICEDPLITEDEIRFTLRNNVGADMKNITVTPDPSICGFQEQTTELLHAQERIEYTFTCAEGTIPRLANIDMEITYYRGNEPTKRTLAGNIRGTI